MVSHRHHDRCALAQRRNRDARALEHVRRSAALSVGEGNERAVRRRARHVPQQMTLAVSHRRIPVGR
ncbi:hypothetical protein [Mycolicibacterium sp.]|uniref:hypothetical protein n=1 Tax=Mycolicibacterium sp. TaxID=2320850 RepID=UPI0037CA0EC7